MSDLISFGVGWEAQAGYRFRLSVSQAVPGLFTIRATGGEQELAIAVTLPELEAIASVFNKVVERGRLGNEKDATDSLLEALARLPKANP